MAIGLMTLSRHTMLLQVLAVLAVVPIFAAGLHAQVAIRPDLRQLEVHAPVPEGTPVSLARRERSGAAREGAPGAAAVLSISSSEMLWRVLVPAADENSGPPRSLRLALMLWNGEPSVHPPPSVLYLRAGPNGVASLSGRALLGASLGKPRLVRLPALWPRLGVGGRVLRETGQSVMELSIPLAAVRELCPSSALVDVRLQSDDALYSYGATASWFDPPDASRALRVTWGSAVGGSVISSQALKLPLESLASLPVEAGPQLWALSSQLLPLDQGPCGACGEVARTRALVRQGKADAAIDPLRQIVESSSPADLAWQEGSLELQAAYLAAGRPADSLETGLRILEAEGIWDGAVIRALRTLAAACLKARVKFGAADSINPGLKARFLRAVADRNSRAAYGADFLILQGLPREAAGLLANVQANPFASRAARAHALFRLEQLSARSGDWRQAVALAEQIQTEAPLDIRLRGASLTMLSQGLGSEPVEAPELWARMDAIRADLMVDSEAICTRYFSAGRHPVGCCPVRISKEE